MVQVIGDKGGAIMKKKIDNDMPVGKLTKLNDFLPPPEALVLPQKTVKVTLRLTESSLQFFKIAAKKHHTKYQQMIRSLIDSYAGKYSC